MRWLFLLALLLVSYDARAATDSEEPVRNYAKTMDDANLVFLKQLHRLVEGRGFRDVRIIPQLFVAKVKGVDGKDQTLIINSDTLETFAFDGTLPLGSSRSETAIPDMH